MKIACANIVALCFIPAASGFVVKSPKVQATDYARYSYLGGLGASPEGADTMQSRPGPDYFAAGDSSRTNALESRLAALEKGKGNPQPMRGASGNAAKKIWDQSKPITVQGGSLKTWSFASPLVERVQVVLKTEGRPLDANVELWQGPDNTPHKMRVYVENGEKRPFAAVVETPSCPNTISLRNTGQLEFPFYAYVSGDTGNNGPDAFAHARSTITTAPRTIQGGALRTYPFEPNVDSVKVLLTTDGRPLNARIELLQGPNNNKQVVELYTEDGNERPFFAIIETPGSGNVVRIVNTATVEFPLTCSCEPHMVGTSSSGAEPVIGGDPTSGDFQVDQW